jgi:hypothetical protein
MAEMGKPAPSAEEHPRPRSVLPYCFVRSHTTAQPPRNSAVVGPVMFALHIS